jgi:hypothetical protein
MHEHASRPAERFDLLASGLAQLTPVTEVLAVIAQKIVAALPQPRTRTPYDVATPSFIWSSAHVKGSALQEGFERNLLYATARIANESGIMDDAALAGINSVVSVAAPAHHELGSWDWLAAACSRYRCPFTYTRVHRLASGSYTMSDNVVAALSVNPSNLRLG